jgi:HlyD family secretion protein
MRLPVLGKVSQPRSWIIGFIAAGLLGAGGVAYLVTRQAVPRSDIAELTVPVKAQDLTVRITASGTIRPVRTVNLSPKASGRLERLYVEQGDAVKQGQVIAQMENDDIQAQLVQARAEVRRSQAQLEKLRVGSRTEAIAQARESVAQAEAQVRDAQSRLSLASQRTERNRDLAAEGAISTDQLDEVLNTERSARAGLQQAQARVRETRQRLNELQNGTRPEEIAAAEAELQSALGRLQAVEVQEEDTRIRAPFSGVITQRFATEGAFVTPTTSASATSSATSTSIVALASGLEVVAEVPEVDLEQIRVNQKVEIVADAYPDQVFQGKVRLVAPEAVVEQNVTSFQVRVNVVTGLEKLRSGMNVDATFLGNQLNNALVVPTVAIVTNRGQTGVLMPGQNNQPRFQPVTIGPTIGNQTQVLQGIQAGDQVFTELPPGQRFEDVVKRSEAKE